MLFNPVIDYGHILTFTGIIFGALAFALTLKGRLSAVEKALAEMKDVLVDVARQDERLSAMEKRVDDLQHGRGFVFEAADYPRVHLTTKKS